MTTSKAPIPDAWKPFARPPGSPVVLPKLATLAMQQQDQEGRTQWGLIVVHKGWVWWDNNIFRYHPLKFSEFLVHDAVGDCLIVGCHIPAVIADVVGYWLPYAHFNISASPIKVPGNGKDWSWLPDDWLAQYRPDKKPPTEIFNNGVHIKKIGWKQKGHGPYLRKHYPIDPYSFAHSLPRRFRNFDLYEMVEWAEDLQSWFNHERPPSMKYPSPAFHKVAAGLMRAHLGEGLKPSLNERIRPCLPGNVYMSFADPRVCYPRVYEIDQSGAHHHSAIGTEFPNKSGLLTFGHCDFEDWKSVEKWKAWTPDTLDWIKGKYGLLLVGGTNLPPVTRDEEFRIPPTNKGGAWRKWLFTNEIPYLLESGVIPQYVCAAWLSPNLDQRPAQYAEWALQQLKEAGEFRKDWMKPMLLAVWGLLGARPFTWTEATLRGKGDAHDFHFAKNKYLSLAYKEVGEWHGSFVNIIHRGMIEAETRVRTLSMARNLTIQGFDILAVYADGVYVAGKRRDLPFLPPQWKVTPLTNAHFPQRSQVICDQYAKLPGFSGSVRRAYLTRYQKVRERD